MFAKTKKLLSLVLAFVMFVGLLPITAFAVNEADHFVDVPANAWYYDAVSYVYDKGLMVGVEENHFAPTAVSTRGMIVTVLHRMEGEPAGTGEGFTDVADDKWYSEAVRWSQGKGIVEGDENGHFRPDEAMSREELVAVFYRYAKYKGYDTEDREDLNDFIDSSDVQPYAVEALRWAIAAGLINGFEDSTIRPSVSCERAQLATVLMRVCTLVVPAKLSVQFDLNYEGTGVYHSVIVREGQMLPLPASPERQGYYFVGWYMEPECVNPYDTSAPVTQELTLYAGWEEVYGAEIREEFFVAYLLNDGSGDVYVTVTAEADSLLTAPDAPERPGYVFTGWYTEESCIEVFDFSTPVTSDLVLFAGWDAPSSGEDGEEEEEMLYDSSSGGGTIYSIADILVADGQVETTINVNDTAILHVEFLSEDDGSLLIDYSTVTPEYCELTPVAIPLDYALPEYFLVRATLYSTTGEQLCAPYTCIRYGSAYTEFEDRTVSDYEAEGERVLNFTPTLHTNFGVLADGVVEIPSSAGKNVAKLITVEDTTVEDAQLRWTEYYLVSNPDEQMLHVEPGTVVLLKGEDGTDYLVKVGTKTIDENGSLIIVPAEGASLVDFYKALKVDMTILMEDEDPDQIAPQAEVIDVDICKSGSLGGKIKWSPNDNNYVSIEGSLKGTGKVDIEMKYDAKLFGEDYFECSTTSILEVNLDIEVFVSLPENDDDDEQSDEGSISKFPDVHIPTPITGLTAFFEVSVPVEFSLGGGLNLEINSSSSSGFKYDTNNGYRKVDKKERTVTFGLQGKAELKFGPKIELGIAFMKDVVTVSVNVWVGAKAEAVANLGVTGTTGETRHACTMCLSGTIKWFLEVTAELKFCIIEDVLEATPIDATLFSLEGWINILRSRPGEFYVSLINSADSIHGGKVKFGGGSCPNEQYRVEIKSEDEDGNATTGVLVEVTDKKGNLKKRDTTDYVVYLYDGIYKASASFDGRRVVKSFVVSGNPATVTINPNSANGKLNGKIINASTKEPITGATILISQGGYTFSTCTSDSSGSYTANLPAGVYLVDIQMGGYVDFSIYVTVEEGQTKYLQTTMLVNENTRSLGGAFSGKITSAVDGKAIEGVELEVRKAWNNPGEGDVVARMETDANGFYETEYTYLFKIMVGLPAGNYTVHATFDGYADTDYNVVVLPNMVRTGMDFTMSPGMAGEDYRIVLSWGASPSDLDSHYNALTIDGYRDHVYYSNKLGISAELDWDDTSSYGPETITVTDFEELSNGFVYSVHDFTNNDSTSSTALSSSGAMVEVYCGSELVRTYHVPTGREGTVWHVFSVNAAGRIIDLNEFEYESSASRVGASFVNTASNLAQTLSADMPKVTE